MQQKKSPTRFLFFALVLSLIFHIINSFFLREQISLPVFFLFLVLNVFILIKACTDYSGRKLLLDSEIENLTEQTNLAELEIKKSLGITQSLKFKITRYNNLKKIIEDLNRSLRLETVIGVLSSAVYSLISNNSGSALFYLVDKHYHKLNLVHSIKDDSDMVVQAKEGDIFDQWVLRHSTQLLIEDLKNDFRFDTQSAWLQDMRPIASLISSPLINHNSLFGILRLESKRGGVFNQDDLRFLAIVADMGAVALENSLLFQKKQELAIHDDLTGLYTRHYFCARLKDEAIRTLRLDQYLSLMMVDIDFFKQYNDKFGHRAGDIVLEKIGQLLKKSLRAFDSLLCRFGGEEFLVMLSGLNKQRSMDIAEDLRKIIEKEVITLRRQDTHITVSIGVANLPLDTKDEEDLLQKADKAMYKAKEKGRNQVCCI